MQKIALAFSRRGGDGIPLILGPSLGTTVWDLWSDAANYLGRRFALAGWDLPGHGSTMTPAEPFDLADIADALAEEASRHGIDRFHYAGSSIAGGVGLELALKHPSRVASVITVCSGAKLGTEELWRDRAAQVRQHGTASVVEASAARWFTSDPRETEESTMTSLLAALPGIDDEGYAMCCEALLRFDAQDRIVGLPTPLLAIAGEHDLSAPSRQSEQLAERVADGRSIIIAGAAHLAAAEKPDDVAAAIIAFIDGIRE